MVSDDVRAGIDLFRPYLVEWAPQMRLQTEALAAVPDEYIDQTFLIGSHNRIAERLKLWFESGATGLIFRYGPQVQVGRYADLVEDLDVWETIAKAAQTL